MQRKDTENAFDSLFGRDERTDEERVADTQAYNRKRNEYSLEAFERERERRVSYLAMDRRIQAIASRETMGLFKLLGFLVALFYVSENFGRLAGLLVCVAAGIYLWFESRQNRNTTEFKIGEIDELAEDTVTHERIADFAAQNKCWLSSNEDDPEENNLFGHPYWSDVNERVKLYARQPHKMRIADNLKARRASLPYRLEALAERQNTDCGAILPYWARLNADETNR